MNSYPKISIVTASFNSAEYIEAAIKSVCGQTYKNVEHLVMDGGSKDATVDILRRYEDKLAWVSEPDKGIYDALNKGFARVTGEVITWLDSDNYYDNIGVLEAVAEAFANNPDTDIVVTNSYLVYPDHDNEQVLIDNGVPTHDKLLNRGNQFIPESVFMKKEIFRKVGGLNQAYRLLADYDLWIRIFALNPKVVKLGVVSARYTVRNDALLRKDPFRAWREAIAIGKANGRRPLAQLRVWLKYIWERIKFPFAKSLHAHPKLYRWYGKYLRRLLKPLY